MFFTGFRGDQRRWCLGIRPIDTVRSRKTGRTTVETRRCEKSGLGACLRISPSPMVAEFANLRAMEKKFKEWNPNQA